MWSPIRQLVEAGVLLRGGKEPTTAELVKQQRLIAEVNAGALAIGNKVAMRSRAQTIALGTLQQRRAALPDESADDRETNEKDIWQEVYELALIQVGFRRGTDEFNEEKGTLSYDDAVANLDPTIASAVRTQADNWYRTLLANFQSQAKAQRLDPVKDVAAAAALWVEIVTTSVSKEQSGVVRNLVERGTPSFSAVAADPNAALVVATAEEALITARQKNAADDYWKDGAVSKTAFTLLDDARKQLRNDPNFVLKFTERFESITADLSPEGKAQLRGLFGSGGDTAAAAPAASPAAAPAAATTWTPLAAGQFLEATGGSATDASVVTQATPTSSPTATGDTGDKWVPYGGAGTTNLMSQYERIMSGIALGTLDLNEAKLAWQQEKDKFDQEQLIRTSQRQQEQFEQQLAISNRTLRLQRDQSRLTAGMQRQTAVNQATLGAVPYLAPRTEFLPGQEPGGAMQRLSEFSGATYAPVRTADVTQTFDPDAIAEQALREFDARSSDIPTGVG